MRLEREHFEAEREERGKRRNSQHLPRRARDGSAATSNHPRSNEGQPRRSPKLNLTAGGRTSAMKRESPGPRRPENLNRIKPADDRRGSTRRGGRRSSASGPASPHPINATRWKGKVRLGSGPVGCIPHRGREGSPSVPLHPVRAKVAGVAGPSGDHVSHSNHRHRFSPSPTVLGTLGDCSLPWARSLRAPATRAGPAWQPFLFTPLTHRHTATHIPPNPSYE